MKLPLQYWKADPHQWGPGKTHIIHDDGTKTLCGVPLSNCLGQHIPTHEYDCRACARALESQENREERERRWEERADRYEAERVAANQAWWSWYQGYLLSPEWQKRRAAVLKRAQGQCEGCGRRGATEVHHTTYAHVGNEPLFELRAVCDRCHKAITSQDRKRRSDATVNYART